MTSQRKNVQQVVDDLEITRADMEGGYCTVTEIQPKDYRKRMRKTKIGDKRRKQACETNTPTSPPPCRFETRTRSQCLRASSRPTPPQSDAACYRHRHSISPLPTTNRCPFPRLGRQSGLRKALRRALLNGGLRKGGKKGRRAEREGSRRIDQRETALCRLRR